MPIDRPGFLGERAREWAHQLTVELGRPVTVSFGRARRNVIVARRHGEHLDLRLTAAFADAPTEIKEALTAWLKNGKRSQRACALLDRWIADLGTRLGPPKPRAVTLRPRGEHHDLWEIARALLATEFATELPREMAERVTWGRRGTRPARRSMQLGSFEAERNLVRIHPILDQSGVPDFFVRYVLFHELLHAAVREEPRPGAQRTVHHGPEFLRREAAYADYQRAMRWQRRHLPALFRSAREKRPMR